MATTMRMVGRRVYGGPDVVEVETVPVPTPGPAEVLIRVRAAGLDRATLHLLTGLPWLARLALGVRRPRRVVLGQQVAGEVVAVGDDVRGYAVGDRVCGTARGSFAEFAVAEPSTLTGTPGHVCDVDAATIGVSGVTAFQAVAAHGEVSTGQRVLVLGASGAVGSFAVQLAVHRGAEVTAVCSAAKLDLVRGLGAMSALDYRETHLAAMGGPFDVIVDIGGNHPVRRLRSILTRQGTLVIVGGEEGGPLLGGIQRNLFASAANLLTAQRLRWFVSTTTSEVCAQVAALIDDGSLRPAVDRCVGLDEVVATLAAMTHGQIRGQAVVCP